jgi:hypothetical protein
LVVAHLLAIVPSTGAHPSATSSHLTVMSWAVTHVASSRLCTCGDKGPRPNRDDPAPLVRRSRHRYLYRGPSSHRPKPRGVLPIDTRSRRWFATHHRVLMLSPSVACSTSMVVRRHHWCYCRLQSSQSYSPHRATPSAASQAAVCH